MNSSITLIAQKIGKITLTEPKSLVAHFHSFPSIGTNFIVLSCCSYVKNGVLFIKPTLTADRFGNDFLYTGTLDLNKEGCNVNWDNGCFVYHIFF